MTESGRLIIGEGREGERGGKRSIDRLIQNNLGGREGTAVLGTKGGRSRRLLTPTHTKAPRGVVRLHSDHQCNSPNTQKDF